MSVSRRLFLSGAGAAASGAALIGEVPRVVAADEPVVTGPGAIVYLVETQFIMFSQTVGYPKA